VTTTSRTLRWREYGIEAWALGSFMLSACMFGALVFHPASPIVSALPSGVWRRALMGVLMGLTLAALVYSPWGRRSGAHMNPAVTLTFWRLGKVAPTDVAGYIVAQFLGGAMGVWIAALVLGAALQHPSVRYVVTEPGASGVWAAAAGETAIAFLQMRLVLALSSSPRWRRYTGLGAALGVAIFIAVESPISGMSMNPARTVASAIAANSWHAIWLYFVAPLTGMALAALSFVLQRGASAAPCGKMMHAMPCHFCEYAAVQSTAEAVSAPAARASREGA
jgi:aquaporin Z